MGKFSGSKLSIEDDKGIWTEIADDPKFIRENNPERVLLGLTTDHNLPVPEIYYCYHRRNINGDRLKFLGQYFYGKVKPGTHYDTATADFVNSMDYEYNGVILLDLGHIAEISRAACSVDRILAHEWRHHFQRYVLGIDFSEISTIDFYMLTAIEEDAHAWSNEVRPIDVPCSWVEWRGYEPKLWHDQQRVY